MDDYVTKPLRKKKLLAVVDKWSTSIADCGLRIADLKSEIENPYCFQGVSRKSEMESAPMDFDRAVEEFEGDKQFLMEVLDGFLKNVRAQIGTIRQAISDGDAEVIRKEAHAIKGGAANLTADDLSRTALELENIGKSGVLEGGMEITKRLEKELCRLGNYVDNRWRRENENLNSR